MSTNSSEEDVALVIFLSRRRAKNTNVAIFWLAVLDAEAKICSRYYLGFVLLERCICVV